jgi:hypothetical protein
MTGYELDNWGSLTGRARTFLFATMSASAGPTQFSVKCVLRLKQLHCEADYSLPSSAKVKNVWCLNSALWLSVYAFMMYLGTQTTYLLLTAL